MLLGLGSVKSPPELSHLQELCLSSIGEWDSNERSSGSLLQITTDHRLHQWPGSIFAELHIYSTAVHTHMYPSKMAILFVHKRVKFAAPSKMSTLDIHWRHCTQTNRSVIFSREDQHILPHSSDWTKSIAWGVSPKSWKLCLNMLPEKTRRG